MRVNGGLKGRSRSRIGTGLLLRSRADRLGGAVDDGEKQLGVPSATLASPNVAAPRDESQRDDGGEDR